MADIRLDTVVSTVDALMGGAMDPGRLPAALDSLRGLFNGSKACLAGFGPDVSPTDAVATNPDPTLQELICSEFRQDYAGWADRVRRVPVGEVFSDDALFGPERLRGSRMWRDWMAPQDMYDGLTCRLLGRDAAFWFVDVRRGRRQEAFGTAEMTLLDRLAPVLRRVAEIRLHLDGMAVQRDESRAMLDRLSIGMALVTDDLRLVYANAPAEALLAAPRGALGLRQGHITAHRAADHRRLRAAVGVVTASRADPVAAGGVPILVHGGEEAASAVSVCVMPARPGPSDGKNRRAFLAFRPLAERASGQAVIQRLFDLTQVEARFADALSGGATLAQAAERLGIRISTARTHLGRIFRKTETHQQSQLVSVLKDATLPLRRAEP
jgi:DNA-binding CsgD family transcriptional regulator